MDGARGRDLCEIHNTSKQPFYIYWEGGGGVGMSRGEFELGFERGVWLTRTAIMILC